MNGYVYLFATCFALLLQLPANLVAQEFYFEHDDGDLYAQATAWSYYFSDGNIKNEGPYTSQISAATNYQNADDFFSVELYSQGNASLNPSGQSHVAISALSQAAHWQYDSVGYFGGEQCTHSFWEDEGVTWTLESDIYDPGEGNPYVEGEISVSWEHVGDGWTDNTGMWIVSWNGASVAQVDLDADAGYISVDYYGAGTPTVYFVNPDLDSYSFPLVVPNPDVGDTLKIEFISLLEHNTQTDFESIGNASLDWRVELDAIDL